MRIKPFVSRVAIIDYHVEEGDTSATLYSTLQYFRFQLDNHEMLLPLDLGLNGIFVGGRRQITVSPDFGYGGRSMVKL